MDRIGDLSDVTVGPDGCIYVLSDESCCIARLQPSLAAEYRLVEVDRIWTVPDRPDQPEGLVVLGDGAVLVATDHEEPRENLFLLRGLEASPRRHDGRPARNPLGRAGGGIRSAPGPRPA